MNWIIIVAGGNGERTGLSHNKVFAKVGTKPLIYWTLNSCQESPSIDRIVISIKPKDIKKIKRIIKRYNFSKVTNVIASQKTRQESTAALFTQMRSALLAYAATDTIKVASDSNVVVNTPLRKNCWCAQTPQVARYKDLFDAYNNAEAKHFIGTDDTQLLEQIGIQAVVVPCSRINFKVTYTEDIELARKRLPLFLKSND